MKLITFEREGNVDFGVLMETQVYPLKKYFQDNFQLEGEDLRVVVESGKKIPMEDLTEHFSVEEVKILPPFLEPNRNVLCIGKNYAEHVNEIQFLNEKNEIPTESIYFSKLVDRFSGTGEELSLYGIEDVDYEAELAVIIGKKGRDIEKDKAREYVFGYTIANDLSARTLQLTRKQWFKGKSLDGFCPIGPCIVTADEFAFPPKLRIRSTVNGELRQDDTTDHMLFDIPTILSDFSKHTTLKAGDIFMTGTPSGVGGGFPKPKYVKSGDVCQCEVEGIGVLENRFR